MTRFSAVSPKTERNLSLDGLRYFAFLSVYFQHMGWFRQGWVGVDLFFILSGLLITTNLLHLREREGYLRTFYLRRSMRLLPAYLLYIFIVSIFDPSFRADLPWHLTFTGNIKNALFGFNNGPGTILWSLCVEEHFYLIWPFFVQRFSRRALANVALLGILITAGLRVLFGHYLASYVPLYVLLPFRMDLLLVGAGLALLVDKPINSTKIATICFTGGIGSFATLILLGANLQSFGPGANSVIFNAIGYGLVGLFFSSVVKFILQFPRSIPATWLAIKPLAYLGQRTYFMYLWHTAIIIFFSLKMESPGIASLLVVTLLAVASYRFFEAPLMSLGKTWEAKIHSSHSLAKPASENHEAVKRAG